MYPKRFFLLAAFVAPSFAADVNVVFRQYTTGSTSCDGSDTASTPIIEGDRCINQQLFSCADEEIQSFTNAQCTTPDDANPAVAFDTCTVDNNNSYTLFCDNRPDSQVLEMITGTGCNTDSGQIEGPNASFPVIVGECYPGLPGTGFIMANVDNATVSYKTYSQDDCSGDPQSETSVDLNSCGEQGQDGFVGFAPLVPGAIIVDPTSPPPTTVSPTTLSPTTATPTTRSPVSSSAPSTPTTSGPVPPTTQPPSVTTAAPAPPTSLASITQAQSALLAAMVMIVAILA